MNKLFYILFLLPLLGIGQTADKNYVLSYTYRDAATASDLTKTRANITYYDGLGRPIQQIAGKQSGTGTDIITHIEYDVYGRQAKEYLPYAATTANLAFVGAAKTNTESFYNTVAFENTVNPYSQSFFEDSPLNRVLKQAAPGNIWKGDSLSGADHTVKTGYQTNTAIEVKRLKALAGSLVNGAYTISISYPGNYAAGQLYKTIVQDENEEHDIAYTGIRFAPEEFRNKEGQVILKRTFNQASDTYGMPVLTTQNTYYVYDQFGNLTYVLPPVAAGVFNEDTCYQYKYDSRNRMVEKKLPGKQWEFMVYDTLDRVVATGPSASPFADGSTGWTYNFYDYFNRTAVTGWYPVPAGTVFNSILRNTLQQQTDASYHSVQRTLSASVDNITIGYELRGLVPNGFKLLTVSYYDDYAFPNGPTPPTSGMLIETQKVLINTKRLATGAWVRVLSGPNLNNATVSYTFYDSKARAIRINSTNYLGGYNQTDTRLDFDGSTLYTINRHKKSSASTDPVLTTKDTFTYTAQDRLLSHTNRIGVLPIQLIAYNTYNKIGQLIKKKVGGTNTTGTIGLQHVDFKYSIRGWLKDINNVGNLTSGISEIGSEPDPQDLFAFKINYTDIPEQQIGGIWACYNGNIAETSWRTASDNIQRRYGYTYDKLNRLTDAWYQIPQATVPVRGSYDEHIQYDVNGNITSLQRNGDNDTETTTNQIDNLIYTYHATKKNQLIKVNDPTTNNPSGFKDGANTNDDYEYDDYGNMIKDRNKGITTNITYNHLNLPVKIILENGQIEYLYDAAGAKLKKTVTNNQVSPNVITDYFDSYQYTNGVLDFFPTAEGYVKHTVSGTTHNYNYVFNYTDHLGNVRLSYTVDPEDNVLKIMEESHYYPFGLKHKGYNGTQNMIIGRATFPPVVLTPVINQGDVSYKYKFQGQERQDELNLNWDSFKWRNYDYAIGRFMSIDPLAEDYTYNSPYAFQENKMGLGRELEGLELGPLLGPMAGMMLETTNTPPLTGAAMSAAKATLETGGKTSEIVGKVTEAVTKTEEHHLTPRALKDHPVVKAAREEGFKFEGKENKIPVSKFSKATGEGQHGPHPKYTDKLKNLLDESSTEGLKPVEFVRNMNAQTKKLIEANPGTKINDIFKTTVIENTNTLKPELPKRLILPKHKVDTSVIY